MKRSILVLLCVLMAVLGLASCDILGETPDEHTHTYATTLSSDELGHWYAPTCDCDDAGKKDFAAHADVTGGLNGGKDGKCDTCAYVVCAHTYATEWSKDADNHWHAVTCGCDVAVADKAAHAYTEDGCVCGYMQELDLTDVVASGTVTVALADVEDLGGWWLGNTTITVTVPTPGSYVIYNGDWLLTFATDAAFSDFGNPLAFTTTEANQQVTFYVQKDFWSAPTEDATFEYAVVVNEFDIVSYGQAELVNGVTYVVTWTAPAAGLYYIFDFESSIVWDGFGGDVYYVMSASEAGEKLTFTVLHYDESEAGDAETFTFNWFVDAVDTTDVTVGEVEDFPILVDAPNAVTFTPTVTGNYSFAASEESVRLGAYYESEYGNFIIWHYSNSATQVLLAGETYTFYVKAEEAESDITSDFTIAMVSEVPALVVGDNTLTLAEGDAAFDGVYYILTAENAGWYTISANGLGLYTEADIFLNEAFELAAGEVVIINLYSEESVAGEYTATLTYSATEPEEQEPEYDTTINSGYTSYVLVAADGATYVTFTAYYASTYVISVLTENGVLAPLAGFNYAAYGAPMTVTVTEADLAQGPLTITYEVSTTDYLGGVIEIAVEMQEEEDDYGEYVKDITVTVTDNYLVEYIDFYEFTATVAGDYAFIVPAGLGFWIDGEDAPYIDYNDLISGGNLGGAVVVTIQAGETFRFSVGAATKGDFTIELYADEPSSTGEEDEGYVPEDPFDASYSASLGSASIVVVFDKTTGTVTVTPNTANPYTCDFVYADGVVTLTKDGTAVNALMLDFTVTDGVPTSCVYNGNTFTLTAVEPTGDEEEEEPAGLAGTYTATDDWGNSFTVVITADTITFTPPMSNEVVVTYTYENGVVTLYADGSAITNPGAMSLTITGGVVTGMMYNMTSYTLAAASGDEEASAITGDGSEETPYVVAGAGSVVISANYYTPIYVTVNAGMTATLGTGASFVTVADGSLGTTVTPTVTTTYMVYADSMAGALVQLTATGTSTGGDVEDDAAFAGTGSETDPYVVAGAGTMDITATYYTPIFVTVNAGMTATLTEGAQFITNADGPLGTTVTPSETTTYMIYADVSSDEGTAVTLTATVAETPVEPDGTESNPFIIESLPFNETYTGEHDYYFSYTATADCSIILVATNGSAFPADYSLDYKYDYEADSYVIYLKAGETALINLFSYEAEATYTITSGEYAGKGSPTRPISISTYSSNSLDVNGADADGYAYFNYTSYMLGTLTLTFTGAVDVKYGTDLEALTSASAQNSSVVIDIADGDFLYILVKGDSTVTFSAATAYKLGTENNPIVLENWAGDHTCDYTGSNVYYEITGGAESGYVTLTSAFEGVSLGAMASDVYIWSYSNTGSIRFYLEAGATATFFVGDSNASASATIAFNLTFAAGEHELDGSAKYPFEPETVTGDFTCNFGGGYSYVWYKVTTTATGYLTVSSDNANAKFVISPATSSYEAGAKEGTGSVSYGAPAGVCYIGVMTADQSAGEIAYTVSFEEGELEPDGSSVLPYTAVVGENTANVSSSDGVWYKITVDSACTITLSSDFVSTNHVSYDYWPHSEDAMMAIASTANTYAADAVTNYYTAPGADVVYTATEAGTYYINIGNNCFAYDVQEVTFTVTVTPAA